MFERDDDGRGVASRGDVRGRSREVLHAVGVFVEASEDGVVLRGAVHAHLRVEQTEEEGVGTRVDGRPGLLGSLLEALQDGGLLSLLEGAGVGEADEREAGKGMRWVRLDEALQLLDGARLVALPVVAERLGALGAELLVRGRLSRLVARDGGARRRRGVRSRGRGGALAAGPLTLRHRDARGVVRWPGIDRAQPAPRERKRRERARRREPPRAGHASAASESPVPNAGGNLTFPPHAGWRPTPARVSPPGWRPSERFKTPPIARPSGARPPRWTPRARERHARRPV